jgi:hypothetical protein
MTNAERSPKPEIRMSNLLAPGFLIRATAFGFGFWPPPPHNFMENIC